MWKIRNIYKTLVEILGIRGGSRPSFGDNIRIYMKEIGYEVANLFQMSRTDCSEHTLIINSWVSCMVGITFLLSERLIRFEERFYPRELATFCRHINAVLLTSGLTAAGGDRNRQPLVIKLQFKMFTSRISLFHSAFFNSIMDKTPTHALFTQHYISLAC